MNTQSIGMKNLKSRKLYMQVYDELRDYILQKQLRPGDMLPTEMEMCETLGVSRNVLREAIKALEITGVVASKPGVGIMIQEFNPDFLFQTLFYNLTSDSEAMLEQTLAVRRTLELGFLKESFSTLLPDDIEALKKQVSVMEEICRQKSARPGNTMFGPDFYRADSEFHKILYHRVGNVVLSSIIDAVWSCDRFHKQAVRTAYMESTVEKHRRIVAALAQQDFDAYTAAMHHHFDVEYKTENT